MFVSIAGKQMTFELSVQATWDDHPPWLVQGRSLSHRSTFCSLSRAVSLAGFQ